MTEDPPKPQITTMKDLYDLFQRHCGGDFYQSDIKAEVETFLGFFDKKTGAIYIPEKTNPTKIYLYDYHREAE